MMTGKHLADLSAFLFFAPVLLRGETIQECINRTTPHRHSRDEDNGSVHAVNNNGEFNFYESTKPLTWCQSFMKCKKEGQQIAVVHDRYTQEFLFNNSLDNVSSGDAWVAGRRKDFGTNWTWLSDDMPPLENKMPSNCNGPRPLCRMTVTSGTINMNKGAELLSYFICANSDPEKRKNVTWYEAMNECADIQGRLAVYTEVVNIHSKFKYHTKKVRSYWIGLYYKPWIWILGGNKNVTYRPVYHSFWRNVSNAEEFSDGDRCLAVEGNSGKWVAHPCEDTLNHFICQSTSADSIDIPDKTQSTTTHRNVITDKTKGREKDPKEDMIPTKEVYIETTTRDKKVFDQWIVVIISTSVSVSVLILLVSVCVLICVWKRKKIDSGMTGVNLLSLSLDDHPVIKSKNEVPLGGPKAQHEYSFLRDSMIYTKPKNLKPHLPPRDQTYNQPYEDTRVETESETETDLGEGVEQSKQEVDGVRTGSRMNPANETLESEEAYLEISLNAKPENDDGPVRGAAGGINTLACVTRGPIGKTTNGPKETLLKNRLNASGVREVHRPKTTFY